MISLLCSYTKKNNTSVLPYKAIDRQFPLLDLVSGGFFNSNQKIIWLTETRTIFLKSVLLAGENGIHQSELVEIVYGIQNIKKNFLYNRLRNLAHELSKIEINIILKSEYFFIKIQNSINLIIPTNKIFLGPIAYLNLNSITISSKQISKDLQISHRKASTLIKKWKAQGLVNKAPELPYGQYVILLK